MRIISSIFLILIGCCDLYAQLRIQVTAIPANTPASASIYLAGNFNNWNPSDANSILEPQGNGQFSITIDPTPGTLEFKFTRGDWSTVEGNASGGFLPNRTYEYAGGQEAISSAILSWEGTGNGSNSTAAWNVAVMDPAFSIPQLNRNRRIWIYLPPDYFTSTKYYPVLYFLDGQNVFDASTSFSGEWGVDETLNALFDQGDYGCIAVAIDNGGASRLDEYSPWVNSQYGGGEGADFLSFLVDDLKPFIDNQYRSLSDADYTAIIGSSMGGLFAQYALSERQDVFNKAGILSPAFWFADDASKNHVLDKGKNESVRAYYLAGADEPNYVTTDMIAVEDAMHQVGFSPNMETRSETIQGGQHSEWFWKQEFAQVYQWLFEGFSVNTSIGEAASDSWSIRPNPSSGEVFIEGIELGQLCEAFVFGSNGVLVLQDTVEAGAAIHAENLPNGVYLLKIVSKDKPVQWQRLVLTGKN